MEEHREKSQNRGKVKEGSYIVEKQKVAFLLNQMRIACLVVVQVQHQLWL